MACLPIAISAGFEVQSGQYKMSLLALKNLKAKEDPNAPLLRANIYLQHINVLAVRSLENTTHAHMFLWANPLLLQHAMSLVAWSDELKVLTVIYRGTPSELRALGLVSNLNLLTAQSTECDESTEFTKQQSVTMPGQHSYSAYVMCMTPERRARMRSKLPKPVVKAKGGKERKLHLNKIAEEMAEPEWLRNIDTLIGLGEKRSMRSGK